MSGYRTPLKTARGLGSAKHGVGHWVSERVAAVALVPLVVWILYSGLRLAKLDYEGARAWVAEPVNATLVILTIAISFSHMAAGLRVIVEDYIERPVTKAAILLANAGVCVLAGALAIISILKVALGGV
jgi:succinate dehydrogenase / fumarate reductase membrane anchor subunit